MNLYSNYLVYNSTANSEMVLCSPPQTEESLRLRKLQGLRGAVSTAYRDIGHYKQDGSCTKNKI